MTQKPEYVLAAEYLADVKNAPGANVKEAFGADVKKAFSANFKGGR